MTRQETVDTSEPLGLRGWLPKLKRGVIQYLMSCAVALIPLAVLYGLRSSPADVLWVPGMLLADIVFPQGVHSNFGLAYFYLAMVIDVLLYGGLVMLIWRGIDRLRAAGQARK